MLTSEVAVLRSRHGISVKCSRHRDTGPTDPSLLWCGDFNMIFNPTFDSHNYINLNNPRSRTVVMNMMEEYNLVDTFRYFNPEIKRFTWRRQNPLKQARLDDLIASSSFTDLVNKTDIIPGYRSDHSILQLDILLNKFYRGKGSWKFNTNLLKDINYLKLINECIQEEIIKYAVPVYNIEKINLINEHDIHLRIPDDLFLEMLILRMRGESVKFSSIKKRNENIKEKKLISEIQALEKNNDSIKQETLESKKHELIQLREQNMKGHYVRSRVQWLHEGERPTQYFCSLEQHNYLNKTIKKVKKKDNTLITDQGQILLELKNFYSQLYRAQDESLKELDLDLIFKDIKLSRITNDQATSIEGDLKEEELFESLKNMKNNKSPGIDGFPAEFLKAFWKYLGKWILRALNTSFKKGILPLTLRQCLLTCLPKSGKPREFIKNWRPLSMLSVIYKLASASIANRIKPLLNGLISQNQNGFVPGRYIGESTRLIYDIMHAAEKSKIPGLLMLIDFEKAYDSISWKFIYKVLTQMGFTEKFIGWIKLFNKNIETTIMQNGVMSEFIKIGRGCRQGDPISAYLFIMAAEVLNMLITYNDKIVGIKFNNTEFKLSQYADDTTLILDGSQQSLQNALNILEIFGTYSGLKVNTDKTKIIWIGKKKHSNDKLISQRFDWNTTEFNMLGLKFSVDLQKMPEINFRSKLVEIKDSINHWSKRKLTPMGKVTVIKTFLMAKLNHLFLSLPHPDINFINELNNIFYKFIWSNKTPKINRKTLTLDYHLGGIKMVQLEHFIMALKITWVRRLIKKNAPWVKLFRHQIISDINKLLYVGSQLGLEINKKITNNFWIDVFKAWDTLCNEQTTHSYEELLSAPLWYNTKLSIETMYFPNWYRKGIILISDVLDVDGSFFTIEKIKKVYSLDSINPLNYIRAKTVVNKYIHKYDQMKHSKIIRPVMPMNMCIINTSKKGAKSYYRILEQNKYNDHKMKVKWNQDFGINIDKKLGM